MLCTLPCKLSTFCECVNYILCINVFVISIFLHLNTLANVRKNQLTLCIFGIHANRHSLENSQFIGPENAFNFDHHTKIYISFHLKIWFEIQIPLTHKYIFRILKVKLLCSTFSFASSWLPIQQHNKTTSKHLEQF